MRKCILENKLIFIFFWYKINFYCFNISVFSKFPFFLESHRDPQLIFFEVGVFIKFCDIFLRRFYFRLEFISVFGFGTGSKKIQIVFIYYGIFISFLTPCYSRTVLNLMRSALLPRNE